MGNSSNKQSKNMSGKKGGQPAYPAQGQGHPYPPQQAQQGYPPQQAQQGYYPSQQPVQYQPPPPVSAGEMPPPYAGHNVPGQPYMQTAPSGYYAQQMPPPAYNQQTIHVQGGFEAGARFDVGATPNIPPPPPGCAPNSAQMATAQGHNVVMSQQKSSFMSGTGDGGYVIW